MEAYFERKFMIFGKMDVNGLIFYLFLLSCEIVLIFIKLDLDVIPTIFYITLTESVHSTQGTVRPIELVRFDVVLQTFVEQMFVFLIEHVLHL